MNLAEYRKHKAAQLMRRTLPSGLDVVLRPIALETLAMQNVIPLDLLSQIEGMSQKAEEIDIKDVQRNSGAFISMVNAVATNALVEPAITGALTDTTLDSIEFLDFEDRFSIFENVTGATKQLAPFRQ